MTIPQNIKANNFIDIFHKSSKREVKSLLIITFSLFVNLMGLNKTSLIWYCSFAIDSYQITGNIMLVEKQIDSISFISKNC